MYAEAPVSLPPAQRRMQECRWANGLMLDLVLSRAGSLRREARMTMQTLQSLL